jgi:hypothetical protein
MAIAFALAPFATGAWLVPSRALASDPFEIQVYDGTANAPGTPGLELHLNQVGDGDRAARGPMLSTHHQTHATLEPSMGVTQWWELGAYLQSARRADGTLDFAGGKLRSKFVTPEKWDAHLRLGVNFELGWLPERYDASRYSAEMRPIVAWEGRHWLFALNPIVGVPLAGAGFREGPGFEPALKVMLKLQEQLGVGFEYYADLGPIASPAAWRDQEHYLYEVIDLLAIENFELNAGIGEGLTPASNGVVMKLIVGYSFDPPTATTPGKKLVGNSIAHNRSGATSLLR